MGGSEPSQTPQTPPGLYHPANHSSEAGISRHGPSLTCHPSATGWLSQDPLKQLHTPSCSEHPSEMLAYDEDRAQEFCPPGCLGYVTPSPTPGPGSGSHRPGPPPSPPASPSLFPSDRLPPGLLWCRNTGLCPWPGPKLSCWGRTLSKLLPHSTPQFPCE